MYYFKSFLKKPSVQAQKAFAFPSLSCLHMLRISQDSITFLFNSSGHVQKYFLAMLVEEIMIMFSSLSAEDVIIFLQVQLHFEASQPRRSHIMCCDRSNFSAAYQQDYEFYSPC